MEIASTGVKVVLIEPGGFKTGIWEEGEKTLEQYKDSHYDKAYKRSLQGTRLSQPIMGDPAAVARVVVKAISGNNPRARYLVGYDAQFLAAVEKLTPTMVKDRVSRLTLGL
jgi:NAD(P)-dependent dehydrogenase (short-subunit alcohol dehydrogenase family)